MIPFLGPADPFPPVDQALDNPDGLLAAGASLSTRRLLDAYRHGIFPWFSDGDPILWWSPDPRTVLHPSRVHVSHSLRKRLRKEAFMITVDRAFAGVLDGCAAPRGGRRRHLAQPGDAPRLHRAARRRLRALDRSMDGRRARRRDLRRRDWPDVFRRVDVHAAHRRVEDRDGASGRAARSLVVPADRLPARNRAPAVARRRTHAAAPVCG